MPWSPRVSSSSRLELPRGGRAGTRAAMATRIRPDARRKRPAQRRGESVPVGHHGAVASERRAGDLGGRRKRSGTAAGRAFFHGSWDSRRRATAEALDIGDLPQATARQSSTRLRWHFPLGPSTLQTAKLAKRVASGPDYRRCRTKRLAVPKPSAAVCFQSQFGYPESKTMNPGTSNGIRELPCRPSSNTPASQRRTATHRGDRQAKTANVEGYQP
jgi:hypothetical protein